jgi:hypothetical protein
VRHHRALVGLGTGLIGLALTLAPMSAASAKSSHKPKGHHPSSSHGSKGSNPNSTMCQDIKGEENNNSQVGEEVEKAIASGNFSTAQSALLSTYKSDLTQVDKALSTVKSAGAPANVQAAFKNLGSYVNQFETAISSATSFQGMLTNFETLAKNTQIVTDGTTITNWAESVCGSSVIPTTTTTSLP